LRVGIVSGGGKERKIWSGKAGGFRETGRCASFLLDLYRKALRRTKPLDLRYAPVNSRLGITKEINLKS